MRTLRDFWTILDRQTVIVTLLAVGSTFVCRYLGFQAKMPTALISVAIIFPIVFSINAAYRRREEALKYFASLKAHLVAIYFAHFDWVPEDKAVHSARGRELLQSLLDSVKEFLTAEPEDRKAAFAKFYSVVTAFSASLEDLRKAGMTAGEVSRSNQYLRSVVIEFERMRNILEYRTPVLLRAYSRVFLNSFPILFGPFFANVAQQSYPIVGYGIAIIYSLVLVSLDNIQEHLENPFDQGCEDDVVLDVVSTYEGILPSKEAE